MLEFFKKVKYTIVSKILRRKGGFVMNDKAYTPSSVEFAVYLNSMALEKGCEVGVTKLQKWLYICYGLFLVWHNERLFEESPIAADYGPFFQEVHAVQRENNGDLSQVSLNKEITNIEKYEQVVQTVLGRVPIREISIPEVPAIS